MERKALPPWFVKDHPMASKWESFAKDCSLNALWNERKYTVGDSGISYRVISHWGDNNILPDGISKAKGWHKFSFIELVWLKTVTHLRDFGFSLKRIAAIKKQVIVLHKKYDVYPIVEFHVASALYGNDNPCFVILADGSADIGKAIDVELFKYKEPQSVLLIPLKVVLAEMGYPSRKPKFAMPVTAAEFMALDAISLKRNKEITIRKSKGEIREIEETTVYSEHPLLAEINQGFKDNAEFGEVVVKFDEGKIQSAHVKKRRLLK
jgi:hypothetical protein